MERRTIRRARGSDMKAFFSGFFGMLGVVCCCILVAVACAGGGLRPKYSDFKDRDARHSLYFFEDENTLSVNKCKKWQKDNTCKDQDIYQEKITTKQAKEMGLVAISPDELAFYLNRL